VAADLLAGNTLGTRTVRDHTGNWKAYTRRAACPDGTVAYGGGAFTSYQGSLTGGLSTFGSVPDATGWTYSGAGVLHDGELVVSSHCLPRAKLGTILTVSSTVRGPDSYSDAPVFTAARCPAGSFAFTRGAFYHQRATSTPQWKGLPDHPGDDRRRPRLVRDGTHLGPRDRPHRHLWRSLQERPSVDQESDWPAYVVAVRMVLGGVP
jgi:hypothetical protein